MSAFILLSAVVSTAVVLLEIYTKQSAIYQGSALIQAAENKAPAYTNACSLPASTMTTTLTSSRQKPEQSSGKVTVEGDKVIWHNEDLVFSKFNLSDIIVIGENTNSNGPWFDDWFLTFVTKDGNWFNIPWYADNIDELTKSLCERFQPDLNVSYLTNSTKWDSIIRHPSSLRGSNLFLLRPIKNYKEPKNFFEKMLSSVGLGHFNTTKEVDLTDDVKKELTNDSQFFLQPFISKINFF